MYNMTVRISKEVEQEAAETSREIQPYEEVIHTSFTTHDNIAGAVQTLLQTANTIMIYAAKTGTLKKDVKAMDREDGVGL